MAAGTLDMIELEFLDEPNQLERYYRFGVNPDGMVMPIEVDPRDVPVGNWKYILIGQTPVPESDVLKWAEWFETADRVVAQTEIGASVVSTVFMGLDHRRDDGPPLLFETAIFTDGEPTGERRRCATWDQAEAQHRQVVTEISARRI
jgi:hypothetical protein